jgi:phosphoribosylamine---glycine ligase
MGVQGGNALSRILLVDRSGRGHAYADLLVRTNPEVTVLYAPGCAAISHPRISSLPELNLEDPRPYLEVAASERVDFVLVGNTLALAAGFVDAFHSRQIPVIGPDKAACRLETSKLYCKLLCEKYGIPVADFAWFDNAAEARAHVERARAPVVIKADGLCGGNGSFVCDSVAEAIRAIDLMMAQKSCGAAGERVVIERKLEGRELSIFAFVDGHDFTQLPMALDYPKSDDDNRGVTCGGMGAVSPHPLEADRDLRREQEQLMRAVMRCIASEGLTYTGVIYLGCMLTDTGLVVLEINVRLGDPEAEVVLPRISSDFMQTCQAVFDGHLGRQRIDLDTLTYCDVVATQGPTVRIVDGRVMGQYPGWPYGQFGRHYPISGLDRVDGTRSRIFIGEALQHRELGLVSDGGRVLHVVGFGADAAVAARQAYENIAKITFEGIRYRTDIGAVWPWEPPKEPATLTLRGKQDGNRVSG